MNASAVYADAQKASATPPNAPNQSPAPLPPKTPQFPPHNAPRVWIITNGASPVSINLARHLLHHGDYIVLCVIPAEVAQGESRTSEFGAFLEEVKERGGGSESLAGDDSDGSDGDSEGGKSDSSGDDHGTERRHGTGAGRQTKMKPWRERVRVVPLDSSSISQAQAVVAEALTFFSGGVDVLLISTPSAVLGTIEELSQAPATSALVREQFETNFFANVALIKAVLPAMRKRKNGHIMLLSGVTGHLGTPGISTYCASQWAMEGYCDSLAYEIAPFNVRMTIVQPNVEVNLLTNKITTVPPMDAYAPDVNPAPLIRDLLSGLMDKLEGAVAPEAIVPRHRSQSHGHASASPPVLGQTDLAEAPTSSPAVDGPVLTTGDMLSAPTINSVYAPISSATQAGLVAETVFALAAIGGHDNPPARHIVGFEGATAVTEKLKTVSEELEEFIDVSAAVDFEKVDVS